MAESIATKVMAAIVQSQGIDPGRVTPGTTFEDLDMSSLDALALINALEEQFEIAIPNEEAMGLRTVGETIACVERLLPEAVGP